MAPPLISLPLQVSPANASEGENTPNPSNPNPSVPSPNGSPQSGQANPPNYSNTVIFDVNFGYAPTYWDRVGWSHQGALGLTAGYRTNNFYFAGNFGLTGGSGNVSSLRFLIEPGFATSFAHGNSGYGLFRLGGLIGVSSLTQSATPPSRSDFNHVTPVFGVSAYLGGAGLMADRSLGVDIGGLNLRFYTNAYSMVGIELLGNLDPIAAILLPRSR